MQKGNQLARVFIRFHQDEPCLKEERETSVLTKVFYEM